MELGVQSQSDLGRADMQKLVLVILCTAQFTNHFAERIILARA